MKKADKRYVVYHPETKRFWLYTDISGVDSLIKTKRNYVARRLKDGSFEYDGYVIGEPDVVKSKRGSGDIEQKKNRFL